MDKSYLLIAFTALMSVSCLYMLLIMIPKGNRKVNNFVYVLFVIVFLTLYLLYQGTEEPPLIHSRLWLAMSAIGGLTLIIANATGIPMPKWQKAGHASILLSVSMFLLIYIFNI
jgi:hypothetical protein